MKSERSRAASDASSPSKSLWPVSIGCIPIGSSPGSRASSRKLIGSRMVFEVWSHALAQEHRVMAFEDPLAGPMAEGSGGFVGLELVEGRVVGKVEQDHVVEVPAVGDVEPADEADAELLLVVLHLPREDRPHEELEERVSAAADAEVGREHGHRCCPPRANGPGHALTRRLLSHGAFVRWRLRLVAVLRARVATAVLELADRLRGARERPTAAAAICADEP